MPVAIAGIGRHKGAQGGDRIGLRGVGFAGGIKGGHDIGRVQPLGRDAQDVHAQAGQLRHIGNQVVDFG